MKKLAFITTIVLTALFVCGIVLAEQVSGYYRSNGTYVAPYTRSDRNSTVTDNYSFKGNTNPYTGKYGTSYYRSSPSSPYYNQNSTKGLWDR